jgi:hypothetical protein
VAVRQLDLPIVRAPREPAAEAGPLIDPFGDEDDLEENPFELEPGPDDDPSRAPPRAELLPRAQQLAADLSQRLERPVRLSVTDNRSTMVSFRRHEDVLLLRVHHMFLDAPEDVLGALADYAGRGRSRERASAIIDAFVRGRRDAIRSGARATPSARLVARGRFFDLREIYDALNARFFGGAIDARIGWGRGPVVRRRRTIRMGVYDHQARTIRLHPALDSREVPRFFVEYIVFHEMLHQAVPGRSRGGRHQHHGPDFRARERAYPDFARATAWEQEHLPLLLGKPSGRFSLSVD